ncbi:MAG: hypothetical protein ACREEP_06130 [Dongiaceae bacterium]
MAETLLSLSRVLLYGRVVTDLVIQYAPQGTAPVPNSSVIAPPRLGANNFLDSQLAAGQIAPKDVDQQAKFARIYGFSFEGYYYDLPKPALFLVHGDGTLAEGPDPSTNFENQRFSRAPSSADRTGLGSQTGSFARDMRVWTYDKGDFSIRLDALTGPLEQILLDTELSGDRLKTQIGAAAMMRMRATRGSSGD